MTRTSRARIFPLTLTNEAEEAKLRGGKGRLKQPSPVEAYSCRWITNHINLYTPVHKPLISFVQVNNHRVTFSIRGVLTPCQGAAYGRFCLLVSIIFSSRKH